MTITVILCTYNRAQSLSKALESAANLMVPDSIAWEVLVVDNNSNDETKNIVEQFSNRHPNRFRYLFEPRPGKSYALNSGIQAARGNILAFIDDDVIVETSWLNNLTTVFHADEFAGAGGRILPEKNFSPPSWLACEGSNGRYALAPLALFDLGDEPCQLNEPPFGTNMAFRKEMFEKYGPFRTDLGPRPGSEIRNEDTEFGHRLLAAGEKLRYQPSAVVYHPVAENRIQKKYYLNWWFDKGRADIRQLGIPADASRVLGIPIYLFRRVIVWTLRWLLSMDPARRFNCKIKVWSRAGEIVECYAQRSR
jgi:glucosyl-dolichyl phosphate glucuronosyltransferase